MDVYFGSSKIKPKGFTTYQQLLEVSPLNSFNQTLTSELIKFQFKTRDYIDPKQVYFDVLISAEVADLKGTCLLLDGTASSLIQELQIFSNNRHLETIREHDEIMNILNDITVTNEGREGNQHLGFQPLNDVKDSVRVPGRTLAQSADGTSLTGSPAYSTQYFCRQMGFQPNKVLPQYISPIVVTDSECLVVGPGGGSFDAMHTDPNHAPAFGIINTLQSPIMNPDLYISLSGSSIDTGRRYLSDRMAIQQRAEAIEAVSNSLGCQGTNKKTIYYNHDTKLLVSADTTSDARKFLEKTHRAGFLNYNSDQNTADPCVKLDPTYGRSFITAGKITDLPQTSKYLRLSIPLNSAVFGALLPEHKFIPGKALDNVEIQVRLNPYAFFLSGLDKAADSLMGKLSSEDVNNYAAIGDLSTYQVKRKWKIESMVLKISTLQFDEAFTRQLEQQLAGGITLRSNGFEFSQSISVKDSRFIQGNWMINTGVQSLRSMFVYIQDDAYQKYTYCRKNFRLSANITSLQLKMNSDYYPRQPIMGHAGNPYYIADQGDNSEFIIWYQKQFGLYNKLDVKQSVNKVNFAINERSYDPACETVGTIPYASSKDYLLNGVPGIEEQRYVGKAIYPFNFSSYPADQNAIQGIDTNQYKPFDLLIKCDQVNYFPNPCTLKILHHFNIEVQISSNGVQVFGYV